MEDLKEYFEGYMKDSIAGELFHGSPKKLDVINPHVSSHGMAYVYASPDYKYALCYAGQNWNDFEINQAYVDGQLCLTEIQKGKFIEKFQRPGYVYHLNKDDFKMIPNHPKKEFISEEEVVPLTVDEIPNVYRRLSAEGIQFYTYPDLPPYIKDRKQYIMDRAKSFYVQDNPQLLEYLCKSFPDMEDDFRSYCTSYTGKGKKSEISTEGVSETADIPGENEENLETYTEGTILGSKDKMYNMDLWGTKANQKNVLFITGLIGSGKSWTAKAIANKYNATWFSLDWLYQTPYAPGMKDPKAEALLDRAIESSSLFRKFVESGYSYDKLADKEKNAISAAFKGARDAVIKAAESDKNHLYVIEGIQVIWYMSEFSLASYPILFKGASVLKSAKQSIKRGVDLGGKFFDKFLKEVKEFPNTKNDDKRMREMIHAFEEFARILDDVDASMKKESVDEDIPKVYFTRKITPESLIRLYHLIARDKDLQGKVMVKISTGEPGGHNFLQPSLIGPLVNVIHGTICDANTAYEGARQTTESHYQVMKDHGFSDIAPVDVLDADGEIEIPVNDGYYLKTVPVGSHNSDYGTFLILSHFKGHAMAGFGGAMKNIAIGMASRRGKAIVHSGGKSETEIMGFDQQVFLKSMVDSLKASIDFGGRDNFLYINVANNLSVDCDCDAHPADPTMADIGVFASTDPLAIDQACIDAVDRAADNKDLVARIKRQTGRNMLQYAEDAGIGSRKYELVDLDKEDSIVDESAYDSEEFIVLGDSDFYEVVKDLIDKGLYKYTFETNPEVSDEKHRYNMAFHRACYNMTNKEIDSLIDDAVDAAKSIVDEHDGFEIYNGKKPPKGLIYDNKTHKRFILDDDSAYLGVVTFRFPKLFADVSKINGIDRFPKSLLESEEFAQFISVVKEIFIALAKNGFMGALYYGDKGEGSIAIDACSMSVLMSKSNKKFKDLMSKRDSITTEAFKECNTLEDAIDNVFSHNSVVTLWTDGENEDGSHCGYNVYHGMAHAIPDKFRKCEIQKIEDILDTDHPDAIHIRIDAGYMTPSKFEEFKLKEIDDKINDLFKEYSDPPHREEPMNTTPEQVVPSSHSFLRNNDEEEKKPVPGFSSSITKESVIFNQKDSVVNLDKWKPEKGHNILFITGLSGSGKSTLAEEYETKYHAHMFELDGIEHRYDSSGTATILSKVRDKCKEYDEYFNDTSMKAVDHIDAIWKAANTALDIMEDDYKTLYIVEGVQLFDGLYSDNTLKGKPLIIKNTSHLTSIIRALKRTSETDEKSFAKSIRENLSEILAYHRKSYKPFKKFKQKFAKESVSDLDAMFKEAVESFTATTNEDAPIMKTDLNDLRKDFSKKSEENTDESAGVMEFLPYVGVKKDPPPDTDYPGSPFKALEESYETIFEFKNESANETVTVMETPFSPNSVFLNVGDYHYPDIIKELVEDVITDIENGSSDYAEKSNLVWHITGENSEPLCAIADELGFVQIPNIDPKKSDTVTYAMDIQEFTPEKTQYTSEAGADVSNIFRADEDYVYLNVPYCEFYIPTEYFAMGKKFAEDFTEKIHVIGLFNVGIFEDGKLVDVRVFNVPVYLDINVYEFEVRMIDIGSGTPIECRVYKYYQDSIICRAFIAENSGVAQTFLQLIISGNMPGTIPYSQVLSVWRKNLELSGVNLGVSSAIMEMILAVMYRDAKDPSKKYCIRYGSTADSSEFDYMSASIRQICQYNSTFTGIIYEDIDSMITSAINRNRNGKEEGDTPMEKIIKM